MRHPLSAVCGLWIVLASGAAAEQASAPVVVEFYTSQGCSSCPPADAFFATLVRQPGVIPLALHVDYWDYIGWKDRFASPAFTERQKAYARAAKSRTIYTPQMIVNGDARVEGNDAAAVAAAISAAKPGPGRIDLTREGGHLRIRAEAPLEADGGTISLQLVRYRPEETVEIAHGENAGQVVSYHNIVTEWTRLAEWPGQPPLEIEVPEGDGGPAVVLVQRAGPGAILAAVEVK
ncbi:MAG: DUF1223 domain-containing protein [Gemmobacter sp.]|nr:DUF1223 domain-containing protein [Gemmobacter sp.]